MAPQQPPRGGGQGQERSEAEPQALPPWPLLPRQLSGIRFPWQMLALLWGCWHGPLHHWDVHSWQNSCQQPPRVKLSQGPEDKYAESGFFSKSAQKRGL